MIILLNGAQKYEKRGFVFTLKYLMKIDIRKLCENDKKDKLLFNYTRNNGFLTIKKALF